MSIFKSSDVTSWLQHWETTHAYILSLPRDINIYRTPSWTLTWSYILHGSHFISHNKLKCHLCNAANPTSALFSRIPGNDARFLGNIESFLSRAKPVFRTGTSVHRDVNQEVVFYELEAALDEHLSQINIKDHLQATLVLKFWGNRRYLQPNRYRFKQCEWTSADENDVSGFRAVFCACPGATPPRPPLAGRLMSWADQPNNLLFDATRPMAADWLLIERLHVAKSSAAKRLCLYDEFVLRWNKYHTNHFPHHGTL